MTAARAYRHSAGVRFDRAVARAHVARGGSLTVLLRDDRAELAGVRVLSLVQWVPSIGPCKAERILLGLPHHYRLRELEPDQRRVLLDRLAEAERALIQRRIYQEA